MPAENDRKKAVRAKLFNLRSAIDGLIQMVDADAMPVESVPEAVAALSSNCFDQLHKLN